MARISEYIAALISISLSAGIGVLLPPTSTPSLSESTEHSAPAAAPTQYAASPKALAAIASSEATTPSESSAVPENPTHELPSSIDASIPDSAQMVAENIASLPNGTIKNLETGAAITDPHLVGTFEKAPDPLAKTAGESFIPVPVAQVREARGRVERLYPSPPHKLATAGKILRSSPTVAQQPPPPVFLLSINQGGSIVTPGTFEGNPPVTSAPL